MFEQSHDKNAGITLCMFPHLREFIAIDVRQSAPGAGQIHTLKIEDVLGDEFMSRVELTFSRLLRRPGMGFIELMGLPQEVEAMIRGQAMRRIVEKLTGGATPEDMGSIGSVGVLVFTGTMLRLNQGQLTQAVAELFGDKLSDETASDLLERLSGLIEFEQQAESETTRTDLARLISGQGDSYMTIWESGGK